MRARRKGGRQQNNCMNCGTCYSITQASHQTVCQTRPKSLRPTKIERPPRPRLGTRLSHKVFGPSTSPGPSFGRIYSRRNKSRLAIIRLPRPPSLTHSPSLPIHITNLPSLKLSGNHSNHSNHSKSHQSHSLRDLIHQHQTSRYPAINIQYGESISP